tara:strand:- start:1315 stop:3000 length:1686 start_codon:yes stop_codon:yes gene_type:complete
MQFLGKNISGKYTIPSGIITVSLDVLEEIAKIPQIGVLTTKSVGPVVREGNPEPVYAQINKDKFTNAVGLPNPGAEYLAEELKNLKLPEDKFLLVSILGGTPEEFKNVAKLVEPYADGLELNFSCPHAEGLGQAICSSPEIAISYVKAVQEVTNKPLLAKLSPNIDNIKEVSKALIEANINGFTAINTVGPEENKEPISQKPVLSHKTGGISGNCIKDIGVQKVKEIKEACQELNKDLPIIGMGGISSQSDIKEYEEAGATILGIGTALTGMSTKDIHYFFQNIENPSFEFSKIKETTMQFEELTLKETKTLADDLIIQTFDKPIKNTPGQFNFLWIPGLMEKPFSPATINPASFAIRVIGPFTQGLKSLKPGDKVMIRGPYGNGFTVKDDKSLHYCLIGGGTGIAPLYYLTQELSKNIPKEQIHVFLGGRSKNQIYLTTEFKAIANVYISTDDGSEGFKGFVTQLFEDFIKNNNHKFYHYICGPEIMMKKTFDIAKQSNFEDIEASMERYMKCGVGICGICSMDGSRTCVDGTVYKEKFLSNSKCFGISHRKKTGELEKY